MAANSKINWTDKTWNPTLGCSRVSAGCDGCYAIRDAHRLASNPNPKVAGAFEGLTTTKARGLDWTAKVRCLPSRLLLPMTWKKPCRIFVNSMSDLFHEQVPNSFIDQVFAVMALCPQHVFQVLTKRPERMRDFILDREIRGRLSSLQMNLIQQHGTRQERINVATSSWSPPIRWPLPNVHLGVSCEDQATADDRVPFLLDTDAAVRFLSLEPLLGAIDIREALDEQGNESGGPQGWVSQREHGIDWLIVGGESGPGARPMHPGWARSIRDQCVSAGVAFFMKQWGGWIPKSHTTRRHPWHAEQTPGSWPVVVPDGSNPPWGTIEHCGEFFPGATPWNGHDDDSPKSGAVMFLVGKSRAGRILDGREWNEMPALEIHS